MQGFPNGRYWWLVNNPDSFGWDLRTEKKEICWDSHNDSGSARNILKAFQEIRKGDWLLGYIAGGKKCPLGVYALLQCTSGLTDKTTEGQKIRPHIRMKKVRDLDQYIPWELFRDAPALKNAKMVRANNLGCLFPFTDKEQVALLKLLRGFRGRQYWTYTPGSTARGDWNFKPDIQDGVMGLRQYELGDLRKYKMDIKRIARDMRKAYKVDGDGSGNARYLIMFRDEMNPGDVIFVKRGKYGFAGVGIVSGEYHFDRRRDGGQVRAVKWVAQFDKKSPFAFCRTTLARMSDPKKIKKLLSLAGLSQGEIATLERSSAKRVAIKSTGRRMSASPILRAQHPVSQQNLAARLGRITRTERLRETYQRAGQRELREYMLGKLKCCAVTGLSVQPLLVASHIKDWKKCKREERLDEKNVLLLASNYDAAFDRKLISFDSSGRIVKSDVVSWKDLAKLGVKKSAKIPRPCGSRAEYLSWHRARLVKVRDN